MAVNISPQMYSGGAVVLPQQNLNLYAQLLARKQAKEDAIDEYYKKLPSTLNSAGMRYQDIEGLNGELKKMQQEYMQNKSAIQKGTTPEALNYNQHFNEIRQRIEMSKNAAKTDLELGKMRFNKENGYIFDDPNFIKEHQAHTLPIWDANHKELDLGTVAIPPKPFDVKDQDEYYKSITSGMEAGKKYDYSKSYTNPQTGQVIVPTIDILNDDQIKKAAQKAMELVGTDKSKQLHFDKLLNSPNKADWQVLQDAYSKYFPNDEVDSPEKAAAADAIIKLSVPKKYAEEQEQNYQQKQAATINKIYLQDALIRGRDALRSNLRDFDIFGKYADKVISKTKRVNRGTWYAPKYDDVIENIIPATSIDAHDKEYFNANGVKVYPYSGGKGDPDYYIVRDDDTWEGDGGQVIDRTSVAQAYADKAGKKRSLGTPKKKDTLGIRD